MVKKSIILVIGMMFALQLDARNIITEVYFSKTKAYVNEPIQVSIRVYTPTWFTDGLDIGNLKINGAFSVYFRSVSISKTINNQTYAGVELIYNIFPYEAKAIEFPSLEFYILSPVPGDYKGVKQLARTRSFSLHIRPAPKQFTNNWLVTPKLRVYDSWNGQKQSVKVGEVLERSITQRASGTVAELIPPIIWDTIPDLSLYPGTPYVHNYKTKTYISAKRIDKVRYLFEKEGEVIVPEQVTHYWNPYTKRMNKKVIPQHVINVLPNPNLGVLSSIKDSLQKLESLDSTLVENKKKDFLSHKKEAVLVIGGIGSSWILFKVILALFRRIQTSRKKYFNSEEYYFNKYLRAKTNKKAMFALYKWLDKIRFKEPTLSNLLHSQNIQCDNTEDYISVKNKVKKARKMLLMKGAHTTINDDLTSWVNP